MFERYTEKARNVIFLARHEARNAGSPYVEAEHLLLAVLHEDPALARHFFAKDEDLQQIRAEIEKRWMKREKVSLGDDLPLSNESKRILAYAAEEAERLNHRHIGSEHLFLGILREEKSLPAQILHDQGIRIADARRVIAAKIPVPAGPPPPGAGAGVGGGVGAVRIDSRWIEFQNETDGSILGKSSGITVPRIGEELVLGEIRARISRITYHYEPITPTMKLMQQKIVVSVHLLEK